MDSVREAFSKVKEDMDFLNNELFILKEELRETRQEMLKITDILKELVQKMQKINEKQQKESKILIQTTPTYPAHQPLNPAFPTHNPTHNLPLKPLKPQYLPISTGNEGVPTDRQTNQQTDKYTLEQPIFQQIQPKNLFIPPKSPLGSPIEDAAKILDSLDSLKKEIRLKFKQLTDQEILVFSALYQLEEEQGPVDYKTLAEKLKLTESSIRDYIGRLLKKGIPIEKKRINNKQILLSISQNLKKIASLSTILQLRDI